MRNERKKGGAVRPWELIAVNPISSKMVGRNTAIAMINKAAILISFERTLLPGRDEKPTLVLKYISFNDVSKLYG